MSSRSLLPSTDQAHRDAAYRFVVGALYFAVISGLGSLVAVIFGPFGIVVSIVVSLAGVYFGGIEIARGIEIVVRHALAESQTDLDASKREAADNSLRGDDADDPVRDDTADSDHHDTDDAVRDDDDVA